MAKHYVIIHMDSKLQVFDADTERDQLLARVMHYNKNDKNELSAASKAMLGKLADGRIEEVFPNRHTGLDQQNIGRAILYYGTPGLLPVK